MTKASDNAFPSILITEGTEPSAPAAGKQRIYIDSTTHHLMRTNSSGTETDIEAGGSLDLDAIITASSGQDIADALAGAAAPDGTNVFATMADVGGGGGLTQAYAGYNTVGASYETVGSNSLLYAKTFTLANACLITAVECHVKGASADKIGWPVGAIYSDATGAPGETIHAAPGATTGKVSTTAAWISSPLGVWVPSGTYWVVVRMADAGGAILPMLAYDTGTDQTLAGTISQFPVWTGATTTSRQYSIRLVTIR